jgi:hypothetical protein
MKFSKRPNRKFYTFKNFLETHHGPLDKIILSDSKLNCNKVIHLNIDFQHCNKELESYKELKPFLRHKVYSWDCYESYGEDTLEIDLI